MMNWLGTACFVLAVLHTFAASWFMELAEKYPEGSIRENFFHLIGEIEVVFGFWAGILVILTAVFVGLSDAVQYVDNLNFTEPLFVFAILIVSATPAVIRVAGKLILGVSRLLPFPGEARVLFSCLVVGPLLGSLITEPAAMTVTAMLLRDRYFSGPMTQRFRYATLAVLFVNVSIGGVLTHFAAPPVLMVAGTWQWTTPFMLTHFGWKAAIAVFVNAALITWAFRKELAALPARTAEGLPGENIPGWLMGVHLFFLAGIVLTAHHPSLFLGLLLYFIGVTVITREFQDNLKIREGLLVAYFLAGLVVLGGLQSWWLAPLIGRMDSAVLFFGTAGLTAVTDNAALTYLGSRIPDVSDSFKYALVAGAVAGGGLTVIANAPNPAGFSILQGAFEHGAIQAGKLLLAALIPTGVALAALWLL